MNTALTTVTYFSSSNEDLSIFYNLFSHWVSSASFLFSIGIWAIVGFVLGRKAKTYGMNPIVHFCLCFFLHIIGIAISVVLIEQRKKEIANFNRGATNPFYAQQPQNPFDQKYGSGAGYGQGQQPRFVQPNYGQQTYSQNRQYGQPYAQNVQYGQPTYPQNVQNNYQQPFVYDYDIQETMRQMEERDDPNDIRMFGIYNGTYVCPRCNTIQDMGGRCLICNEKIT